MNKGKIVQIIGPVVDIEFAGELPAIYNALTVQYNLPGQGQTAHVTLVLRMIIITAPRCALFALVTYFKIY